jgi:hypothetical protein
MDDGRIQLVDCLELWEEKTLLEWISWHLEERATVVNSVLCIVVWWSSLYHVVTGSLRR